MDRVLNISVIGKKKNDSIAKDGMFIKPEEEGNRKRLYSRIL